MRELYAPFTGDAGLTGEVPHMAHGVPYVETTIADAQMIKYASNAYLATRISFINEVASICESVGADISTVAGAMGLDPRIGSTYLSPGIGFGGPCLEKDLDALIGFARDHQYEPGYLTAVRARNDQQVGSVLSRAREMLGGSVAGKKISVLGLAFKAGTNDVRTSLSLRIVRSLTDAGALVTGHDPVAIEEAKLILQGVDYSADLYESLEGSDLAMILTGWPEYRLLDPEKLKATMGVARVLDGQNLLDPDVIRRAGIEYRGIGR
jgi:UDPglucose 6-dehydrogenase